MNITQNPSPNFTRGRQGWTPDIIICHITEGAFAGAVSWITNPASQVSYHFVVSRNGQIAQAVDIQNTAWANGTTTGTDSRANQHSPLEAVRVRRANANAYTISIGFEGRHAETRGALTEAQLQAGAWLISHIREEVARLYGTDMPLTRQNIVGHSCITPRWKPNCPGQNFPFDEIIRLAQNVQNGNTPSRWAKEAWEWATNRGITDGTNPHGTPTREQMVQLLFNFNKAT